METTLQEQYREIEKTILKYRDLEKITLVNKDTSREKFVAIPKNMTILGQDIAIREGVLKKLIKADNVLKSIDENLFLVVLEGYRSLERQKEQFDEVLKTLKAQGLKDRNALYEEAHKMIAVPNVAGHPTGGAVDVCIFDRRTNEMLDFGTKWKAFDDGKKIYTFSPEVDFVAINNRMLLKRVMEVVGFYQFPGEWWHFSYGDKEWAAASGKKQALYSQVELEKSRGFE